MKRKSKDGAKADEPTELDRTWSKRLQRMKQFQYKNNKTWDRNYKLLFGVVGDGGDVKENEFSYGWGLVQSLLTSIYVQNPEMAVEPFDGSKLELAHILSAIVNYDFDENQMDIKSKGNLGIVECFTAGYAAFIEVLENKKEKKDDDGEEVDSLEEQNYDIRRIQSKDIVFSERSIQIDLSDCPYLAIAFYPTVTDIIENKTLYPDAPDEDTLLEYPEASAMNPPPSKEGARAGDAMRHPNKEKDPDFKTICLWEIWDKTNQKVFYMTDHRSRILNQDGMAWPVKLKFGARSLYPVTLMALHPMPKGFYPKPELDLIANQLDKLNRLDAVIYQDALEKWRKFVTRANFINPDQAAKITDLSVPNSIIEVDEDEFNDLAGQGKEIPNLRELVVALEDPSPKKDMLAIREMAKQEITDILGYGPPERAGMPKSRSAREAMAMKERLDQRLAKRADAIGDFYRGAGSKHLKWLQQTMEVERYARVFEAAKNLTEYRKYDKAQIGGDFNFKVYAGTGAPRTTESRKQSEIQLFQTLMPLIQRGQIPPEPVILRLAEVFQWKGVDALLRNYKAAGKQLAQVLMALQKSSQGEGPKVPPQALPNAAAAAVQAMFSPEELQMLQREMSGAGGGGDANPPQSAGDPNPPGVAG